MFIGILACNFLSFFSLFLFVVSLSGFGIRVMLASYNEFVSVPSSSVFKNS